MGSDVYSLDASSVISGWFDYPCNVFPGLWERIEGLVDEGRLLIAEDVYNELKPKDDELVEWLKKIKHAVVPLDKKQQEIVEEIINSYPNFVNALTGKNSGDPFVIALAKTRNAIVITQEKPAGKLAGPKIPDVCKAEGITPKRFLDILKMEGWSFR